MEVCRPLIFKISMKALAMGSKLAINWLRMWVSWSKYARMMANAVSRKSACDGGGHANTRARLSLERSSSQLEMAITDTASSKRRGSKRAWSTFSGLCGLCSAKPTWFWSKFGNSKLQKSSEPRCQRSRMGQNLLIPSLGGSHSQVV